MIHFFQCLIQKKKTVKKYNQVTGVLRGLVRLDLHSNLVLVESAFAASHLYNLWFMTAVRNLKFPASCLGGGGDGGIKMESVYSFVTSPAAIGIA
jgi:hypothetical protein